MVMFQRFACLLLFATILSGPVLSGTVLANDERQEDAPALAPHKIAQLIEQLGHDRYVMREHAQAKLEELGPAVFDALSVALEHDDLEIANRASYLLGKITFEWTSSRDSKRVQALLKDYSIKDTEERISIVEELGEHGRDEDLGVLCRIVQYDRSHRVSKRAALAMILLWNPTEELASRRTKRILKHLGDSHRDAAVWYRTFIEARDNGGGALEKLQSIAETEQSQSAAARSRTGPDVTARLFYAVADLYAARDNDKLAQQNAEKGLIAGGNLAVARLTFVPFLELRGHFDWAEKEYRKVMELTTGKSMYFRQALRLLSNMHHDQGQLKEAAETHKQLTDVMQQFRGSLGPFESLPESRAQMHYLYSLYYEQQGETEKQIASLNEAARLTTRHPDIMIAQYRLPNRTAKEQARTNARIRSTINGFRDLMRQLERTSRATGQAHNQFAWLVGNTLGEVDPKLCDEAIEASHRSLELSPNSFAYTDTLARCYYARGKLKEAIKYQKTALAQNPHSGLLQAQLKLFQEKLAESESKTD